MKFFNFDRNLRFFFYKNHNTFTIILFKNKSKTGEAYYRDIHVPYSTISKSIWAWQLSEVQKERFKEIEKSKALQLMPGLAKYLQPIYEVY